VRCSRISAKPAALRQLRYLPRSAARPGTRPSGAKALSAIYRTGQRFGAVHLIDVLRGRRASAVARWGHDGSLFSGRQDLDEPAWRGVFRQLVALGFAHVDHAGTARSSSLPRAGRC
jgi:superfamily II DNA helicase RecQ